MIMSLLIWIFAGFIVVFLIWRTIGILAFRRHVVWETASRRGLSYYGKPLAERRKFRETLKGKARFLLPVIAFEANVQRQSKAKPFIPSVTYDGVTGPSYSCTLESFKSAADYEPRPEDVFISTQMKCGTTWMQQVVYEVLCKGKGDFSDNGHRHMYAVSPWIESVDSVSMKDTPLIGEKKKRIIKTHMPTKLSRYSPAAKYIYVTRNPVSCFGSIVDYFQLMSGPLAPPVPAILDWYLSDQMWWLSWPEHVAGWWEWAEKKPNVLFFHFEEMKKNLDPVVRKTAEFLGVGMTEEEIKKVAEKSSFEYMKENEDYFEMSPPNIFSVSGTYFKSGQAERKVNISEEEKKRILRFCKERLAGKSYPVAKFYPAVAQA